MDTQLLEVDLEFEEPEEVVPPSLLPHNRMDRGMLVACGVMACILIAIFIWFEVEHSK